MAKIHDLIKTLPFRLKVEFGVALGAKEQNAHFRSHICPILWPLIR